MKYLFWSYNYNMMCTDYLGPHWGYSKRITQLTYILDIFISCGQSKNALEAVVNWTLCSPQVCLSLTWLNGARHTQFICTTCPLFTMAKWVKALRLILPTGDFGQSLPVSCIPMEKVILSYAKAMVTWRKAFRWNADCPPVVRIVTLTVFNQIAE